MSLPRRYTVAWGIPEIHAKGRPSKAGRLKKKERCSVRLSALTCLKIFFLCTASNRKTPSYRQPLCSLSGWTPIPGATGEGGGGKTVHGPTKWVTCLDSSCACIRTIRDCCILPLG